MGIGALNSPVDIRLARTVPHPREAIFAWWTDFREDDHERPESPATSVRRILRRQGNDVWLQDRATRPIRITIDEHVTLDPPNGYVVEARYPGADVRYAYQFDVHENGTRVTVEVEVQPRRLGRVLVPLTAAWWRRYAARDFDYHLGQMIREFEHGT
jgi:hypothetical protein